MLVAALIAFGHFLAFFSLTAALVIELALISEKPTVDAARRIRRADKVYGLFLLTILVFGLLRVFYFDKGVDFYFGNVFFMIKIGLFVSVIALSIFPAIRFYQWGQSLDRGIAPVLSAAEVKSVKRIIHSELVVIGLIVLCASLMAKGIS